MPKQDDHFDLLVRAGRVVCPSGGMDEPGAIGVIGDPRRVKRLSFLMPYCFPA